MTGPSSTETVRYLAPRTRGRRVSHLALAAGTAGERHFPFTDSLEIGRDDADRECVPGVMLIADPTISWRHCLLTRDADGRFFVRDLSRNGTRVDGRRLVPNIEAEVRPGQRVAVGHQWDFLLCGERASVATPVPAERETAELAQSTVVTVLVGDIRDYTVLVRRVPSSDLQRSVGRVFEILTDAVTAHGGTVKEYQGDAIVAFWEGDLRGAQAVAACQAAWRLEELAREIARDAAVWRVADFPLRMDWALATGLVRIDSFGGEHSTGLSMIGEPIVLAFRMEKFADDRTGPILACRITRDRAHHVFAFRDLGEMTAKGFEHPDRVYALEGPVPDEDGHTLIRACP